MAHADTVTTDGRSIEVACLQLDAPDHEPPEQRLDRVLARIDEVAPEVDLLVLPELWITGYFAFDRYAHDAAPLDGPWVTALAERAAQHRIHLAAGSVVERDGDDLYNTALLLGPEGAVLQSYRKMHLFGYASRESQLLTAGRRIEVAETPFGRVGTTTCYDLRFPELYRLLVDEGLEILVLPAAWPAARVEHWRTLQQARAIENQIVVASCNAAGEQAGVTLGGNSMVIGPWGDILGELDGEPGVLRATIDPRSVAQVRGEFPVLDHRRLSTGQLVGG